MCWCVNELFDGVYFGVVEVKKCGVELFVW